MKKQIPCILGTILIVLGIQIYIEGGWANFVGRYMDKGQSREVIKVPPFKFKAPGHQDKEKITDSTNREIKPGKSYVYKWKDKDGQMHFSNTNFPLTNTTLVAYAEQSAYNRQTPFTYEGGTMVVPATIEHNGRKIPVKLTLDTGCGITQIHPDVLIRIRPRHLRSGTANIADGSTINTVLSEVDTFQVGPFKENNFVVSTNAIVK